MTDKVQKIREEVEKLKSQLLRGACSSQIAMETRCKEEAYNEVLAILDTMQEEPVSIWHDASVKPNVKEKGGIFVITSLNDEYIGSCYYDRNDVTITIGNYDKWAYLNDLVNLSNVERTGKDWKEPASEELEQAAVEAFKEIVDDERNSFLEIFKAGAEWQKEQDKQWLAEEHKHIFAKGRESMKQQMMKGAVDGLVYAQLATSGEIMIRSNYFKSETLDYLDNVKLIIIKEDKV